MKTPATLYCNIYINAIAASKPKSPPIATPAIIINTYEAHFLSCLFFIVSASFQLSLGVSLNDFTAPSTKLMPTSTQTVLKVTQTMLTNKLQQKSAIFFILLPPYECEHKRSIYDVKKNRNRSSHSLHTYTGESVKYTLHNVTSPDFLFLITKSPQISQPSFGR